MEVILDMYKKLSEPLKRELLFSKFQTLQNSSKYHLDYIKKNEHEYKTDTKKFFNAGRPPPFDMEKVKIILEKSSEILRAWKRSKRQKRQNIRKRSEWKAREKRNFLWRVVLLWVSKS
eukprot:GHVP01000220.1.p1 GENE.GHVP01000220.1~~GHVP01000220.1.p1  ORF type:complete len:118 (+),score=17.13 GHVP01000220.1:84-437(+)